MNMQWRMDGVCQMLLWCARNDPQGQGKVVFEAKRLTETIRYVHI